MAYLESLRWMTSTEQLSVDIRPKVFILDDFIDVGPSSSCVAPTRWGKSGKKKRSLRRKSRVRSRQPSQQGCGILGHAGGFPSSDVKGLSRYSLQGVVLLCQCWSYGCHAATRWRVVFRHGRSRQCKTYNFDHPIFPSNHRFHLRI